MEWAEEGVGAEGKNFNIRMLKGLWTLQHKGVAFDAAQGWTSGKDALTFCEKWHLQTTMRFSTGDCGEHAAITLARAWCSKMQDLFDL